MTHLLLLVREARVTLDHLQPERLPVAARYGALAVKLFARFDRHVRRAPLRNQVTSVTIATIVTIVTSSTIC